MRQQPDSTLACIPPQCNPEIRQERWAGVGTSRTLAPLRHLPVKNDLMFLLRIGFPEPDLTQRSGRGWGYVAGTLAVFAMTALIHTIPSIARLTNVSMLYLLVVLAAAFRFGSGPAIFVSALSFLAFDWFFVQPYYTFTVRDPAEWLALVMFLLTAATTGHLTATARKEAAEFARRERETAALAEASWAVASQPDRDRALAEVLRRIADVIPIQAAAIFTQDTPEEIFVCAQWPPAGEGEPSPAMDPGTALAAVQLVFSGGRAVAWEENRRHWDKALDTPTPARDAYLALTAEDRVRGVLSLRFQPGHAPTPAERRVVESLANHAAVALERDRLARAGARVNALAETDRLKTALLSMVSHDFRSPLASIKASASALREEGAPLEPATQQALLVGIEHESDRLNRMVGNILALSRLEADAWRPRSEAIDPAELVGTVLDYFGRDENRRIQLTLDPHLGDTWVDPVQMVQVLHNLIDNALKYSPQDAAVDVVTRREGVSAVLEVLDRGLGLPVGEEERIFERFYRAPPLRESAVPGVGIGLAVCRGLVEAHGGSLTAHSRTGGGTVFRVLLPLPPEQYPAQQGTDDACSGH